MRLVESSDGRRMFDEMSQRIRIVAFAEFVDWIDSQASHTPVRGVVQRMNTRIGIARIVAVRSG